MIRVGAGYGVGHGWKEEKRIYDLRFTIYDFFRFPTSHCELDEQPVKHSCAIAGVDGDIIRNGDIGLVERGFITHFRGRRTGRL